MVMGRIGPDAAILLRRIVDAMTPDELRDYETYLDEAGYIPVNIKELEAAIELHERGWLLTEPRLADPIPVYLSETAWNRFQMAEWKEIERQIDIERAGPGFGSW